MKSEEAKRRSLVGDVLWAPWSIIVWSIAFGWMMFLSIITLPLTLFFPFHKIQTWGPAYSLGWIPRLTLTPMRIHYARGYDRKRVSMFCQNHVSVLDAHVALGSIPVGFCGMMKASHLKLPGYGWLMRLASGVPVPAGGTPGRFQLIAQACKERAARGISILVFPEAHRTLNGKLGNFRRGVFEIARAAGLPLVPIAVRGMYEVLPKGTIVTRPGKIEVYIGPQIETTDLETKDLPALMAEVKGIMEAWIERGEHVDEVSPDAPADVVVDAPPSALADAPPSA